MPFSARAPRGVPPWFIPSLLLVLAAFGPRMEIHSDGDLLLRFRVLTLDLAIWLTLLIFLLQRDGRAAIRAVRVPWSMVGLAVLTAVTGVLLGGFRGLVEALQALDYYVLAFIVFFLNRRGLRRLPHILAGLCLAVALIGIFQLLSHPRLPFAVSSIYEDRNVLGTVMVVLIPSVIATTVGNWKARTRLFVTVIALLGLVVITSTPALLALALAGIVMWIVSKGERKAWAVLSVACVALLLARGGVGSWVFEPKDLAGYHERLQRRSLMETSFTRAEWEVGHWTLLVKAQRDAGAPGDSLTEGVARGWRRDLLFGEGHHLRQEIIEYKAGLGLFASSPLIGRGPGMYQDYISSHYGVAPKLNSMEPNTQSGIVVQAAQTGALGTGLLLAAMTIPVAAGWRRRSEMPFSFPFAGAVGFLAGSLFLPVTQRPESLVLIVALVAYTRMEMTGVLGIKSVEIAPGKTSGSDFKSDQKGREDQRGHGHRESTPADRIENQSGRRRRERDHSQLEESARSPEETKDRRRRWKVSIREAVIIIGCVLAVGAAIAPLFFDSPDAEAGRWMDAHGGILVLTLALGFIALVLRVRRLATLRLSACFVLAWIFSEASAHTVLLDGPGVHRMEFHSVLLGAALLLACSLASRADYSVPVSPPLLAWTTVTLLGGMLGCVLLWLAVHAFYGEPWRTLAGDLWSFALVAYVLVVSYSLLTTAQRARIVIGSLSIGLLLAWLARVLPV